MVLGERMGKKSSQIKMTKVLAKHAIFLLIIQTKIIYWREFVPITE